MDRQGETSAPWPFATYALIAVQILVWLVVRAYLLQGGEWVALAVRPGMPSEVGLAISPFVHLDPAHLGVNLAVLWLFGSHLERAVGALRFLALYLAAAWFAALMQWAAFTSFHITADLGAQNAAVGSSGAIAGVLGACVVRFPQNRLRVPLTARATFPVVAILILWFGYTLVRALLTTLSGVSEGVGHWAHLAGSVFGLGAGQLLRLQLEARREFLEEIAEAALLRDDPLQASEAWSALLAMRPADVEVRTALIASELALGDTHEARLLARQGIEQLVRGDQRARAVAVFREYREMVPELSLPAGVRYRLGCWLAEAGDDELAFRTLLEAVTEEGLTSGAASALYRAGLVAWERLKSEARAREAWERVLAQFPETPWADQARDGLKRLSAG